MTWTKLDDRYWMHPKIVMAGNEGAGIFSRLLSYCGCYETDGKVPAQVALSIAGKPRALDHVVTVGLIQHLPSGDYYVRDYADYNFLRDELDAKRELARENGRKGGLAKARRGASNAA